VREANAIADEVRRRLLALDGVNDVTIHVEAERLEQQDAADLFATVKHAAAEMGLTIHEIWAQRYGEGIYLEMHVGVDPKLTLGEAHQLVDQLEHETQVRLPQVNWVHTHIELASSQVQQAGEGEARVTSEMRSVIERTVAEIPHLFNPHNIHLRQDPAEGDRVFMSLECTVDPDIPVAQAHQMASQLELELSRRLEEVAEVSVHLEPHDQL
jgi:divalent metal cation (Fe/Co/Zn/Cd) transporter